ncbi:MAG: hypothetical protein KC635_19420 [Myxococcales bacterium]|nr:hypothetical protein [Myxococcales bacterium]
MNKLIATLSLSLTVLAAAALPGRSAVVAPTEARAIAAEPAVEVITLDTTYVVGQVVEAEVFEMPELHFTAGSEVLAEAVAFEDDVIVVEAPAVERITLPTFVVVGHAAPERVAGR